MNSLFSLLFHSAGIKRDQLQLSVPAAVQTAAGRLLAAGQVLIAAEQTETKSHCRIVSFLLSLALFHSFAKRLLFDFLCAFSCRPCTTLKRRRVSPSSTLAVWLPLNGRVCARVQPFYCCQWGQLIIAGLIDRWTECFFQSFGCRASFAKCVSLTCLFKVCSEWIQLIPWLYQINHNGIAF